MSPSEVRLGLIVRAGEHVGTVFEINPRRTRARVKFLRTGRKEWFLVAELHTGALS